MKLFVNPFLADTGELSEAEIGAYFRLLMKAWRFGGRLPNDQEQLRKLAQCPKASIWEQRWAAISRYFVVDADGYLINEKQSDERARALGISEKRSDAGIASAEARELQRRERETADPQDGNSSAPKSLENHDADPTSVERRARVQTTQPTGDRGEAAPPTEAQPLRGLDDWPNGNLLNAFVVGVGSPWLDPSKIISPKFHAQAPGYLIRWRAAGCSWLADVLPVASAMSPTAGGLIQSLKFFDGAILDAYAARTADHAPRQGGPRDDRFDRRQANKHRSIAGTKRLAAFLGDDTGGGPGDH